MFSKARKPDICPIFESQRQATFQSPESLVTERKFDTAIRRSQVEGFQKRLYEGRSTLDDQILLEGIRQLGQDVTTLRIDDAVYARYLQKVLTSNVAARRLSSKDHHHVGRIWEAIKLNIQCQVQYMCSNSHLKTTQALTKELQEFLEAKAPDNLLCLLVTHCIRLSSMIERIGLIQGIRQSGKSVEVYVKECNTVNKWKDDGIGLSLVWSNRLCMIQLSGDRCYLMPRPYLLMIHNKLCDLMSVLVCGKSMEGVSVNDDFYDKIILLVKEFCRLNVKMQSEYFTLVKSLESLVVAEALRKVDTWDNKEFYDSLTDELYNSIGYSYDGSTLQNIIQSVDIPSQHELGCLSKIIGHPLINMKSGAKSLHTKTTEQYTLDRITLSKCECHIKINYIRNHIVREKKWPPCYLSSCNVHPTIKEAWARNIDPYHNALKDKYGVRSSSEAFLAICEMAPDTTEFNHFKNYFVKQWMELITYDIFCCYGHKFRTTNSIEGWHRRINGLIPKKPSLYYFLQLFKKEAYFQDVKLKKNDLYVKGKKRRKFDLEKDQKIEKIIQCTLDNEVSAIECLERLCRVKKS